jgi:hypothetical protein
VLGVVDDAPHLLVDQVLRVLGDLVDAGQERAAHAPVGHRDRADRVAHAPAPDHARAICVSCWMSDSAPVVSCA